VCAAARGIAKRTYISKNRPEPVVVHNPTYCVSIVIVARSYFVPILDVRFFRTHYCFNEFVRELSDRWGGGRPKNRNFENVAHLARPNDACTVCYACPSVVPVTTRRGGVNATIIGGRRKCRVLGCSATEVRVYRYRPRLPLSLSGSGSTEHGRERVAHPRGVTYLLAVVPSRNSNDGIPSSLIRHRTGRVITRRQRLAPDRIARIIPPPVHTDVCVVQRASELSTLHVVTSDDVNGTRCIYSPVSV